MPSPSYVPVIPTGRMVSFTAGVSFSATVTMTGAATSDTAVAGIVTGDVFDRVRIRNDGQLDWGPGNGARDTNLYRGGANLLKTDDKFVAVAGLGVGNSAVATTPGTVTRKIEVFDASGASLGFIAVYGSIT